MAHATDHPQPVYIHRVAQPQAVGTERRLGAAATQAQRLGFCLSLTGVLLVISVGYILWLGDPVYPYDDAYIMLHSAQILH